MSIRDKNGKIIYNPKKPFGYTPPSNFKEGMKVLYYVGPHKGVNKKWHQCWTGPWTIASPDVDYNVKITSSRLGTFDVSTID